MMVVPSELRSKAAGGCGPAGEGSGPADTQQATRSMSGMVSGQADCEATGAGAGLAHAASSINEISTSERFIEEHTPDAVDCDHRANARRGPTN